MIRKALIILLIILTLTTGIVLVGSFASGPGGMVTNVIAAGNTMAIIRANRGGVTAFSVGYESIELPKDLSSLGDSELESQVVEALADLPDSYRKILIEIEKHNQQFDTGSKITRFGFALPSPNVRGSPLLAPGMGYLAFPLWFPLLMFAAYPAYALIRGPLRRHRRQARAERNECLHCGYSLTGNETGVCPECGETTCL